MSTNSKIEWTEKTWNPLRGCRRVSEGCRNCYAEKVAARFAGPGGVYEGTVDARGRWNGTIKLVPEKLGEPLSWRRPSMVFVNSMSDLFHEDVPDEYIAAVFGVMAASPQHTFQVLTKRPERLRAWFAADTDFPTWCGESASRALGEGGWSAMFYGAGSSRWPLRNVWIGVSVEDQAAADARIPLLLQTPAAVRWISAEPLLGPVDLSAYLARAPGGLPPLDWVVVGGESGAGARPCDVVAIRSIVAQCKAAGVPCFVKQLGTCSRDEHSGLAGPRGYLTPMPGRPITRLTHPKAGDPSEWPEDLRVREWPREVR